jgi:hypothetical protein
LLALQVRSKKRVGEGGLCNKIKRHSKRKLKIPSVGSAGFEQASDNWTDRLLVMPDGKYKSITPLILQPPAPVLCVLPLGYNP